MKRTIQSCLGGKRSSSRVRISPLKLRNSQIRLGSAYARRENQFQSSHRTLPHLSERVGP